MGTLRELSLGEPVQLALLGDVSTDTDLRLFRHGITSAALRRMLPVHRYSPIVTVWSLRPSTSVVTSCQVILNGDGESMSTPDESFRGALQARTPEGHRATVIVTRQGWGRSGRAWLTFDGAIRTTVMMNDQETARLVELLGEASKAR